MGKYLGGLMFTSPIILSYFAAFKLFGVFFFFLLVAVGSQNNRFISHDKKCSVSSVAAVLAGA